MVPIVSRDDNPLVVATAGYPGGDLGPNREGIPAIHGRGFSFGLCRRRLLLSTTEVLPQARP